MECPRCLGYMIITFHYDQECNQSFLRCVNCGKIIDPVILLNRKLGLKKLSRKSQPRRRWNSKIHVETENFAA